MGRKTSYKQTKIRIFFDLKIDVAADVFIISRIRPQSKAVKTPFLMYVIRGTQLMELGDQETFPNFHYIIMFWNIGFVFYVTI